MKKGSAVLQPSTADTVCEIMISSVTPDGHMFCCKLHSFVSRVRTGHHFTIFHPDTILVILDVTGQLPGSSGVALKRACCRQAAFCPPASGGVGVAYDGSFGVFWGGFRTFRSHVKHYFKLSGLRWKVELS